MLGFAYIICYNQTNGNFPQNKLQNLAQGKMLGFEQIGPARIESFFGWWNFKDMAIPKNRSPWFNIIWLRVDFCRGKHRNDVLQWHGVADCIRVFLACCSCQTQPRKSSGCAKNHIFATDLQIRWEKNSISCFRKSPLRTRENFGTYVCICIYIYLCIYVYIYIHRYVWIIICPKMCLQYLPKLLHYHEIFVCMSMVCFGWTRGSVYIYIHIRTYTYTNLHIYSYIHIHMYIYTYMYIYMCAWIYTYVCMYICKYPCVYTHIYTYMYIYIYIYVYVSVYICIFV